MRLVSVVFTVVLCAQAGCGAAEDDDDRRQQSEPLDWWTSDCVDLGGVPTPAGACFVGCTSSDDCPLDTLSCKGSDVWIMGQCEVSYELSQTRGCGPAGWHTRSWGCYLVCSAEGADDECPSGFRCIEDSIVSGEYFCTGYAGSAGSGCNVPCPDGCCSSTGNSCCEPPFCGGICVGSPCC